MKKIWCYLTIFVIMISLLLPVVVYADSVSGKLDLEPIQNENVNCDSIFVKNGEYNQLYHVMQDGFTLIKFAAPILVIILSSMDYIRAIVSHDAEDLKKANGKFVKRLAIGAIIFLLPFLLDFLFEAFGLFDLDTCGIGK